MPSVPERRVCVVPHDPAWAAVFATEAEALRKALGPIPIILHHIGSTAIPGILAKPIIDLMGEVASLSALDDQTQRVEALGYEALGAFGIEGRRYFRKAAATGVRTHHLHIYEVGSPHLARHLAFRDYLVAHPLVADAYSALKERLVEGAGASWEHYIDGKDPFVQRVEADAVAWWQAER